MTMVSRGGVSEQTHEYHQTILRLAHEFSGTEIAWNVSQHVLDKVWQGTAETKDNSSTKVDTNASSTIIAHSCQSCGFQLHPGWKGSNLRIRRSKSLSAAAKKTLRRRELRKRKKAALAQAQKPKDYHHRRKSASNANHNNANSSSLATTKRLYLLQDDVGISPLDRNQLVLTCGRCGDKTCLKGLKREPPLQWKKAPPLPNASKSTSAAVDNLSGNFEKLPSLGKTKKSPPPQSLRGAPKTTGGARREAPKKSLLKQKMGKKSKKKKKPPSKKSGNLMDFLSSLNDH